MKYTVVCKYIDEHHIEVQAGTLTKEDITLPDDLLTEDRETFRFQNDEDTKLSMDASAFIGISVDNEGPEIMFGPMKMNGAVMVLRERIDGTVDAFDDEDVALAAGRWVAACQEQWNELYTASTLQ